MKYFIPMIILSLVLLSCSIIEEEETQTDAEKAAAAEAAAEAEEEAEEEAEKAAQLVALEGTWKTACYTNSDNTSWIDTLTVAGNVVTGKWERHSGTSCATDYSLEEDPLTISIGDAVTFANGKTGHKFTITIGSTYKLTPQSASAVSAFNSSSACSKSDWVLDTEKECSTGDDAGKTLLCLYQLDGNTWYPKCDGSARPSTSDIDTDNAANTLTKQ